MSGGGAEYGTAPIKAIVGAVRYGYPRDKSGACSNGGRGDGIQGWRNTRERDRESRIGKDGGRDTEMNRITRDNHMEI